MKRRHFKPRNLLFLGLFVLCLPILIAAGLSAVGAVLAALLLSIPLYFFCFVLRLPAWQISKHRKETEDVKSAREEGRNAAQKISEEGIVLLKNEDGLLPLETKKAGKVKKPVRLNLFGRCCIQTFYNGSGSAASDILKGTERNIFSHPEPAGTIPTRAKSVCSMIITGNIRIWGIPISEITRIPPSVPRSPVC